jgi:outer membrane protein OmpA-like peptidoglycan-associated protein
MQSFRALGLLLATAFLVTAQAQSQMSDGEDAENYRDIPTDLAAELSLAEVAERAHDHAEGYYEIAHGHERDDGHDHGEEIAGVHEGEDEHLSAYDAVWEIWQEARAMDAVPDRDALDVIKVVVAVVDAWSECTDTYEAVKRGVELAPDRAAEIAATIAVKRDCNCAANGIWPTQRVAERIQVEVNHPFIEVPRMCSCSQASLFGAVSSLPEIAEYEATPAEDEEKLATITRRMVEKTNEIIERVHATQNRGGWDCGCTDVNLAASMRGIELDDLRSATWDGLAQKYVDEAGDTGLVVDAFGTVGMHPVSAWGLEDINSESHTLRRQSVVYRGDPLILDPFDPRLEWLPHTENDHSDFNRHQYESDFIPTDLFMSEYLHGWNSEAEAKPHAERDGSERNRALELYNGTDKDIDLGQGQYILEIYGPGKKEVPPPPPNLVRHTISLESGVTFDLDKWDIRAEASDSLQSVVEVINQADIFSEILIVGHTCDIATDEYNQLLSERRARSVRDYLLQSGLEVEQIRIEGRGESEPVLPNTSEENRQQNRRVEITFVTREGQEIERKVVADEVNRRKVEFSWVALGQAQDAAAQLATPMMFGDEHFVEGDDSPREVIGLNGRIAPGGTFIIAHDNSDDELLDKAHVVTSQLDFDPTDTLVIRKFGGDRALTCHAHSMSMLVNYDYADEEPVLIDTDITLTGPGCSDPTQCESDDVASPN